MPFSVGSGHFELLSSQVKYINTDKHILRFAKNNRTAARKAFCLIVICVTFVYIFLKLNPSRIFLDRAPRVESCQNWPEVLPPVFRAVWFLYLEWLRSFLFVYGRNLCYEPFLSSVQMAWREVISCALFFVLREVDPQMTRHWSRLAASSRHFVNSDERPLQKSAF